MAIKLPSWTTQALQNSLTTTGRSGYHRSLTEESLGKSPRMQAFRVDIILRVRLYSGCYLRDLYTWWALFSNFHPIIYPKTSISECWPRHDEERNTFLYLLGIDIRRGVFHTQYSCKQRNWLQPFSEQYRLATGSTFRPGRNRPSGSRERWGEFCADGDARRR